MILTQLKGICYDDIYVTNSFFISLIRYDSSIDIMGEMFDDFLSEQLDDPEFKAGYEALQPEHAIIQAFIDARQNVGVTQKELARRTGIAQSDISKLENGNANPSIKTLQRLATGLGMTLHVEFLPKKIL